MDTVISADDDFSIADRLQAAQDLLAQGDLHAAQEIWADLADRFPENADVPLREAAALIEAGQLDAADAVLEAARTRMPDQLRIAVDGAWLAMRRRDLAAALSRWQQLHERFPGDPSGYGGYATALREAGRLNEARDVLDAALERFPNDPGLAIERASVANAAHDWADAARRWAEVRERFPDHRAGYDRGVQCLQETGRFDELDEIFLDAMQRFSNEAWPAIQYASLAQKQGHWEEALRRWETVRERFPNEQSGYTQPVTALRELGRELEAEALLEEVTRRLPDHTGPALEYGWLAHRRHDLAAAIERWMRMVRIFPDYSTGYVCAIMALREAGRLDEAESLADDAARRFPDEFAIMQEHARVAQFMEQWEEAGRRWADLVERFPDRPAGYLGKAAVLRQAKQYDDAEAVLRTAVERFPGDAVTLTEHAWLAQYRQDWPAASERWQRVRAVKPDEPLAWSFGATGLWEQRRFEEADALLQEAVQRFPDNARVFAAYAELATRQNDWEQSLLRWTEACRRFPDEAEFPPRVHIAQMRIAEVDPDAAAALSQRLGAAWTPPITHGGSGDSGAREEMREVMTAFESLGGFSGGCEFGGAQRAFGAEPLGLLRWSDMSPGQLASALEARFEGVGLPENTEISLQDNGGHNEYWTRDKRFVMATHTFISEDAIAYDKMFVQACRRLVYLRNELVQDLESGSRIFLYKVSARLLTDAELDRIYKAIRAFGDTTLFYVRIHDDKHPPGSVEIVKPGLMIGYIEKFSEPAPRGGHTDSVPFWGTLCRNAYEMWQAERQRKAATAAAATDTPQPASEVQATASAAGTAAEDRPTPTARSLRDELLNSAGRQAAPAGAWQGFKDMFAGFTKRPRRK